MKTTIFTAIALIFCNLAFAEPVATYSGSTYTGCRSIGDTNVFLKDPNDYKTIKDGYIYLPNGCESLPQVPAKYLKQDSGQIVEMSQAEKDAVDAAEALARKNSEIARVDSGNVTGQEVLKALRTVVASANSFKDVTDTAIEAQIKTDEGLT